MNLALRQSVSDRVASLSQESEKSAECNFASVRSALLSIDPDILVWELYT